MTVQVCYHTRTGHGEKIADAIAERLGVVARSVSEPLPERADVVFLVCAPYAGKPDRSVLEFLDANARLIGTLVCVQSSVAGTSVFKAVSERAESLGIRVWPEHLDVRGQFLAFAKGHPDQVDLTRAADFAQEQLKGIQ